MRLTTLVTLAAVGYLYVAGIPGGTDVVTHDQPAASGQQTPTPSGTTSADTETDTLTVSVDLDALGDKLAAVAEAAAEQNWAEDFAASLD